MVCTTWSERQVGEVFGAVKMHVHRRNRHQRSPHLFLEFDTRSVPVLGGGAGTRLVTESSSRSPGRTCKVGDCTPSGVTKQKSVYPRIADGRVIIERDVEDAVPAVEITGCDTMLPVSAADTDRNPSRQPRAAELPQR